MMIFLQWTIVLLVVETTIAAPCNLCPGGERIQFPKKIVNGVPGAGAFECETHEQFIPLLLTDGTEACNKVHQLSSICGCNRPNDSCDLCPDGSPVVNKSALVPSFSSLNDGIPPSCEITEAYLHSVSKNDELCSFAHIHAAEICGCPSLSSSTKSNDMTKSNMTVTTENTTTKFEPEILQQNNNSSSLTIPGFFTGAKSIKEKQVQFHTWLVSCILSAVGALVVIIDSCQKKRIKHSYNQIMAFMSVFDLLYSIALSIGIKAAPSNVPFARYGSAGSRATCVAQGVILEFTRTSSLAFNASLSTFYVLLIVRRTTETKLKKAQKWLIIVPVLIGVILGCASIPFIAPSVNSCGIVSPFSPLPPEILEAIGYVPSWGAYLGLLVVPTIAVLVYTTAAMCRVSWHVHKVQQKVSKYRFEIGQGAKRRQRKGGAATNRLQLTVFWQSFFYLLALYTSWLFHIVSFLNIHRGYHKYYIAWTIFHFVTPLQGFLNAVIYMRPRAMLAFHRWLKKRQKIRAEQESSPSGRRIVKDPENELLLMNDNEDGECSTQYGSSTLGSAERLPESFELEDPEMEQPSIIPNK